MHVFLSKDAREKVSLTTTIKEENIETTRKLK